MAFVPRARLVLDWLNGDVKELRERYAQAYGGKRPRGSVWTSVPWRGRAIGCLIQTPSRARSNRCVIVYFHGGGWIVGSPWTHADISGALCERTGLGLFSVDYRLAPEHRASDAVEDGVAVLRFVLSRHVDDGGPPTVILCGDSAGAPIALAVERAAPPPARNKILGVASLYGGFGLPDSRSLRERGRRDDGLDADCLRRMWSLANVPGEESPYSIGALACRSPVPVYILAAGDDPLLDDSLALAAALLKRQRQVVLQVAQAEGHGFLHEVGLSAGANAALDSLAQWIESLLEAAQPVSP
jgi:acetyl esterase/lipase